MTKPYSLGPILRPCPWCGKAISFYWLGKRPDETTGTSFRQQRYIRVCPFCNGAVKRRRKGLGWALLALPLFISAPFYFQHQDFFSTWNLDLALEVLGMIGIVTSMLVAETAGYEKVI